MGVKSTYYINAETFNLATSVYQDAALTNKAADGFYSIGGIVREQVGGTLLPAVVCPPCEFISVWDTSNSGTSNNNQISLPLLSNGVYDFEVSWGDGVVEQITAYNQAEVTHTYPVPDVYTVTIKGKIQGWRFDGGGDCQKIIEISQWGCFDYGNNTNVFSGCVNLELTNVLDTLNLVGKTTLRGFFAGCSALTIVNRMDEWQVGGINNFYLMMHNAINFNTYIGSWDMTGASTYTGLNQPEGAHGILSGCENFNQPLPWDTSTWRTFNAVLKDCKRFNQPLNWNTSQGIDFQAMLLNAEDFNQSLAGFNMINAETLVEFMNGKTEFDYSVVNFDDTLISWAAQPLKTNVLAEFGTIKYSTLGQAAANDIVNTYSWTINSGGLI